MCLDTGCTISFIDKSFLDTHCLGIKTHKLDRKLLVTSIANNYHDALTWVKLSFYFQSTNSCLTTFEREVYIVDKLGTNALIGIDVLKSKG